MQDLVLFSHQKCRFGAGAAAEPRRPSSLVLIANVHISGDPINFMSTPAFVRDAAREWERVRIAHRTGIAPKHGSRDAAAPVC
jgi:hypothetical protein